MNPRELLFAGECSELDPYRAGERLRQVRKEAQADESMMRVCTMNLVVVCRGRGAAHGIAPRIEEIACKYPGRIVVALLEPEQTGPMQAWYAMKDVCGRPGQLGSEIVGFYVPGDGEPIFSMINPLLHDGLPVFFWSRGDMPYESNWFRNLVEASTRVILDTLLEEGSCFAHGPTACAKLLEPFYRLVTDRYHMESSFTELTWGRTRTWRDLVATFFDRPDRAALLPALSRAEIETWSLGDPPCVSMQSMYVAGWLTRQLGVEVSETLQADREGYSCNLRRGGAKFHLALRYRYTNDPKLIGRLSRVSLGGQLPRGPFRLSVYREAGDADTVLFSGTGTDSAMTEHALHLSPLSPLELLGQELEFTGRDSVFEGSLAKLLELGGVLVTTGS